MRFRAIATDYDGTIAHNDAVDASTLAALERAKKSGRKLLLVTGRELPDLQLAFPRLDLFDLAVVENPIPGKRDRLSFVPPPDRPWR